MTTTDSTRIRTTPPAPPAARALGARLARGAALLAALAIPGLAAPGTGPAPVAAQETHLLTVVGLGGGPEYEERFFEWGETIVTSAIERFGLPESNVVFLTEDADDPPPSDGASRAEAVAAAVRDIARRAGPDDRVLVVLIGHGTFRNEEARFNLPGPDLTGAEWAALLDELGDRRVALVNTASASGPFVQEVAGPGRTIITATRTGRQRNETVFGEYFAAALSGDAADLDKDGALSLLEAFTFTTAEVARHYAESGQLKTENAVLDDDGDGVGSEAPAIDTPDGAAAATFVLVPVSARTLTPKMEADSVFTRLSAERAAIERRIAELRGRRSEMDPDAYDAALEELLVELALKNREVEARRAGGGG